MQKLPLANIRVLDFTQVRVGPQITQWLAVMGAEVIRLETKFRPESFKMTNNPGNLTAPGKYRVGYFASLNYSKKSITHQHEESKSHWNWSKTCLNTSISSPKTSAPA